MSSEAQATTTEQPASPPPPPPAETQLAPRQETAPAARTSFDYDPDDPVALYMDTTVFEQLQRVAKMMSAAELVPTHLRGKIADCFLVAAQAFRWRMDPFAVAQHTFVTSGKLGYEGKLVAAVINSHRKIDKALKPVYSGSGAERKVTMVGRRRGEAEDRTIEGTVAQFQTSNDNWKKDPDQMLFYRGAREWARRHAPEILLGVSTEEEIRETVELKATGPDTYAAAAASTLDALAEKVAERTGAPPAPASASTPVEHAKHSETEIPLQDDDTLAAAEAADQKTTAGAPPADTAKRAGRQRTLTEQ
jgi:hypothetical protein